MSSESNDENGPVANARTVEPAEELRQLQLQEQKIDEEIEELRRSGVDESDADKIMKTLHEYNDVRDIFAVVAEALATLTGNPSSHYFRQFDVQ